MLHGAGCRDCRHLRGLCKRHLTVRTTGRALPRPGIRVRPAESEPVFRPLSDRNSTPPPASSHLLAFPEKSMQNLDTIHDYLRTHSEEIGNRILSSYPALFGAGEAPSPLLSVMVRVPYPAQTLAIMGVSKRWQFASNANVVAECGSGKTLIALGSMLVHSASRPFSGLVMAPPHLVEKWARETLLTLPQVRVFLIDDMRNGGDRREPHGINEVRLRRGEIVREGIHTTLSELRRLGRNGWQKLCPGSSVWCVGREKAKLSYFWKQCYGRSRSGKYRGALTNPDTGCPIETDGVRLSVLDFDKKRLHEILEDQKGGRTKYSALWQADR